MRNLFTVLLLLMVFSGHGQEQFNPVRPQTWKTNRTKHTVPLNEIKIIVGKDQIPPIYNPKFWSVDQASKTYFPHEPVIALEINGKVRAYPLSVLMYHEIVNDEVGGVPIIATYCPLCNAAIVFDRRVESETLTFGVSGMLRNSDMVMWDHETESWWQQITGEGIVGKYAGSELSILPSLLISFKQFKENFPFGFVLSTETGTFRNYGTNPYVNYDSSHPFLFKGTTDKRLPALERVINVNAKGEDIVYPQSLIARKKVINDQPNGVPLVIFFQKGVKSAMDQSEINESRDVGAVTVFSSKLNGQQLTFGNSKGSFIDRETKSTWTIAGKCFDGPMLGQQLQAVVHGNHFAFAWLAAKPESRIYNP